MMVTRRATKKAKIKPGGFCSVLPTQDLELEQQTPAPPGKVPLGNNALFCYSSCGCDSENWPVIFGKPKPAFHNSE